MIAHDKEVYDIAWGGLGVFATVSADGSVRVFDLRCGRGCVMILSRVRTRVVATTWCLALSNPLLCPSNLGCLGYYLANFQIRAATLSTFSLAQRQGALDNHIRKPDPRNPSSEAELEQAGPPVHGYHPDGVIQGGGAGHQVRSGMGEEGRSRNLVTIPLECWQEVRSCPG